MTNRILDLVAERIDLAVRGGRSGSSGQVAIPLPPVPFGLLASPGYLEGRALPTALNDLSSHRMLPIAGGDGLRLPGLPSELERELLGPGAGACANTMTMLLQLALAGEGIAILPLHLCRAQLRDGSLIHLVPGWSGDAHSKVWLVFASPRDISARARVLAKTIRVSARDSDNPRDDDCEWTSSADSIA